MIELLVIMSLLWVALLTILAGLALGFTYLVGLWYEKKS